MTDITSDVKRALALLESNAAPAGFDLHALISGAREKLGAPVYEGNLVSDKFEAPEPALVNELLALADQYKREADTATANREQIKDLLKDAIGEHNELTVHGATVFTFKTSISRILNQSFIKSLFPDIPANATDENPIWIDSVSRRALFK